MKDEKIRASYDFLREKAKSKQKTFTLHELLDATRWAENTVTTYISKHLSEFVAKDRKSDKYIVNTKIIDVQYTEYISLFKQSDVLAPKYNEKRYSEVVDYELLLPLTCEGKLKRALENLFYKDMVIDRFKNIGLEKIRKVFEQKPDISDDAFLDDLCNFVSERFGGYSISHVDGRFRDRNLETKAKARKKEDEGEGYLIDETTAVVRFIVPLYTTGFDIRDIESDMQLPLGLEVDIELKQIEWVFRTLFIDAILNTVGQAQIWILEGGKRHQLITFIADNS